MRCILLQQIKSSIYYLSTTLWKGTLVWAQLGGSAAALRCYPKVMKAHILKEVESGLGWSIQDRALHSHCWCHGGPGWGQEAVGALVWLGLFLAPWGLCRWVAILLMWQFRSLKSTKAEAARLLKTEAQTWHSVISISCWLNPVLNPAQIQEEEPAQNHEHVAYWESLM